MNSPSIKFKFSPKEKTFFKKSGIASLYLFGSQAVGAACPMSDFDFGILLEGYKPLPRLKQNALYDGLLEMFESKINRVCNIDIVFLREVSLQLQFQVINDGKVLYEGDPKARADYHEKIIEAYADFLPYQRIFEQATLARI